MRFTTGADSTMHLGQLPWSGLLPPVLVMVACLYAWGGICFAWFQFSKTETPERWKAFLYGRFLSARYPHRFLQGPRRVTRDDARRFSHRAWGMAGLPFIILQASHLSGWAVALANGTLFFGGLFLGTSWYARRCLRLLGVDALGEEALVGIDGGSRRPEPTSRQPAFSSRLARWVSSRWQPLRRRGGSLFSEWSGQ